MKKQDKPNFVYFISLGQYADSGSIEKLAGNEAAIIHLVKTDDNVLSCNGVVNVDVDFKNGRVYYDYIDWDNTIERGTLYLEKYEVITK